jgi:hypothetical protein
VARRYVNPGKTVSRVSDAQLATAQARAEEAAARLRAAEAADPLVPSWDDEFTAATAAATAARRRLEALAALRAAQLERSGRRDAAVKAAGLDAMAAALTASRDQVSAAAGDHLRALSALKQATDDHNALLSSSRAKLAAAGLAVRDDLVDVETGAEHAEGTLDRGVRAGGRDWTEIPAPGLIAHSLTTVFGRFAGPYAALRLQWPARTVAARPDGLAVPVLDVEVPANGKAKG